MFRCVDISLGFCYVQFLTCVCYVLQAAMHADCTAVAPVAGLLSSALKLLQGAPPFQDLPIITQRSAYVIAAVDVRLQLVRFLFRLSVRGSSVHHTHCPHAQFGLGSGDYTRHLVALSDASSPASQEPSNMGLSSVLHVNLFLSRVAGLDLMIQRSSSEVGLLCHLLPPLRFDPSKIWFSVHRRISGSFARRRWRWSKT